MKSKISVFILVFFLSLYSAYSEKIRIMSFNIEGNNSNHRVTNSIWIKQVCAILENSDADIILLQEFPIKNHDKLIIDKFKENLGKNIWECFCTDSYITTPNWDQNNIVFYKADKFAGKNLLEFDKLEVKSQYPSSKNTFQVIEFISKTSSKKFVVINVHLPVPDPTNEKKILKFTNDISTLIKIFNTFSNKKIIMAGDFNSTRDELKSYFRGEIIDGEDYEFFKATAFDKVLSTLIDKNYKDRGVKGHREGDLDHFIVKNVKLVHRIMTAFNPIDKNKKDVPQYQNIYSNLIIGTELYNSNVKYMKDISDHFPVMIDVEIE